MSLMTLRSSQTRQLVVASTAALAALGGAVTLATRPLFAESAPQIQIVTNFEVKAGAVGDLSVVQQMGGLLVEGDLYAPADVEIFQANGSAFAQAGTLPGYLLMVTPLDGGINKKYVSAGDKIFTGRAILTLLVKVPETQDNWAPVPMSKELITLLGTRPEGAADP